ncbi:hypothetical protein AAVH_29388 [Aphelenchoides avenae]|nr:hypothetical protein AAVH_29388 [Aphelenchus avenae]
MSPGGPLVCAKLYGNANCSGFPLLLGVNSSIPDLRHTLELMDIANGDEVTVLVRPLCHVTFWSDVDFKGENDTSSGYLWSRVIDGVLSADCDCDTNSVELLSCEPKEELEQIQECRYFNSSIGGICPYAVDIRPFQQNDENDGSVEPFRYLALDETKTLNTLFAPQIASVLDRPLHVLADEDTKKYLTHASVKPHQGLRIYQRSIRCGNYVMRTTELEFDYEIAQPNTWVLNPAVGRLYYFSRTTEQVTRDSAANKCVALGGRLAILDRPEEVEFAVRVVQKNFIDDTQAQP